MGVVGREFLLAPLLPPGLREEGRCDRVAVILSES